MKTKQLRKGIQRRTNCFTGDKRSFGFVIFLLCVLTKKLKNQESVMETNTNKQIEYFM